MNEQFIELFDIDLITLPPHLPLWFIEQEKIVIIINNYNNNNNK